MKNITLYFTLLLSSILSPALLAQNQHVKNIRWTVAAQIPPAGQQLKSIGLAGAISGTDNQILLIAGGTNFPDRMPWEGGKKKYYDDIFIYWQSPEGLQRASEASLKLPFNLAYSAVNSSKHGIVVAGGENETGLSKKVLLLNWTSGKLLISFLPDLPMGLTNAALTAIEDTVYLAGGEMENGVSTQFLALNLQKPAAGWKKLTDLPMAVSHTVLLSSTSAKTDEVFLIGGRKSNPGDTSTIYRVVYAFDVKKQIWTARTPLPYPLSAASGLCYGNDLLVFSGDMGATFHQAEKLIAEIGREKDKTERENLNQQKVELQSNHPGFSQEVLKYDLITDTWDKLKYRMPYGPVTTHAVLLGSDVMIAGGEIRAGVRTPEVLAGHLKLMK